jgi:hypothetical protein
MEVLAKTPVADRITDKSTLVDPADMGEILQFFWSKYLLMHHLCAHK